MRLNLGCGAQHLEGYVNIDWVEPADLILNVAQEPLPYKDETVEHIRADNLLEHLDNDEFMHLMNECHRVMQKGGVFWFKVPNALDWPDGAFGDPTHKRFFVPRSFYYIDRNHPTWKNYGSAYGFHGWQVNVETDGKFFTVELTK